MAKDDKKGKKQASPDDIMSISEIRPLLKLAKGGKPVSAVVGLSSEGEAVLLMHKQAAPKKLRSMLIKQAQDAGLDLDVRSLRFGRASTDEGDEGVLKLTVNREPSGSALYMQTKKRVKPAGFGDVIFITDPSIENESDDGEAPGAAPAAPASGAAVPPSPAPGPQAAAPEASAAPPPPAPEPPAPPQAPPAPQAQQAQQAPPGPDMSQLTRRLASLIPQVASTAAPPNIKAALGQLATAAGAAVKNATNDAEGLVDRLEDAVRKVAAAAPQQAPSAAPPPAPPPQASAPSGPAVGGTTFARSQKAWIAARKRIEDEIAKLHDGVQAACEEHGIQDVLRKSFETKVEPMLDELDESLAEKLGELDRANDPQQHQKLLGEAKQIISRYQAYVNGNPMIAQLDSNPFVPVTIHKTITATLAVLSNSVR
jgi:hypothetical protein